MRKKGFTLIELLVVVAIIAMLLAILMPALSRVKKIAQRVVCGTNLKGLGTSQMVYSQDFNDDMAVLNAASGDPLTVNWSLDGTTAWDNTSKSIFTNEVTVGASLYLLVKFADTNPKQFVCPASDQTPYGGENNGDGGGTGSYDLVELNDFGKYNDSKPKIPDNGISRIHGPRMHVSFSYHNPYSKHRPTGNKSAQFALMADKNPWMDNKLTAVALSAVDADTYLDYVALMPAWFRIAGIMRERKLAANAQPHDREGQNVMFGDGHSEYAKTSDVGVKFDNIYTTYNRDLTGDDRHRRGVDGKEYRPMLIPVKSAAHDELMVPKNSWDSFLVNDDINDAL